MKDVRSLLVAVVIATVATPLVLGWPAAVSAASAADSAVVAPTTVGGAAATDGTAQVCSGPKVVCPSRLRFGLSVPRILRLPSGLTRLEGALGHRSDLVESYQDFTEPIYKARLKRVISSGRVPVVTWEPFDSAQPIKASYPLSSIAAGKYDRYLKRSAARAKKVKKPFIIRFGHEMNGFWYPWGQARPLHPQSIAPTTNTPAEYRAAYRHVVKVFRKAHATNVAWMWSPNLTDANLAVSLRSLYPGDRFVDVIGISGYLEKPTDTFEGRFRATLDELAPIGAGKPVVIAETGAVVSSTRADQLTQMLTAMSAEPRVNGIIYFSQPDKAIDYRIDDDLDAQQVIAQTLQGPRFATAAGDSVAFALTPQVDGTQRVGQSLSATWAWRGRPGLATGGWLSCPAAETLPADCTDLGEGTQLQLGFDQHNRYLRAVLRVDSAGGQDSAASAPFGPIKIDPAPVAAPGVDLLTGSVRLRMPQHEDGTSNWVLTLDGGPPVYMPASTTEYYLNGLAAGSSHQVSVAAADAPVVGAPSTVSFAIVVRPPAPAYVAGTGTYTVTLPAAAEGQTSWVAVVDGVEESLPLGTTTLTKTGLVAGSHSFGLRAVAGDGRTNPTYVYPYVH